MMAAYHGKPAVVELLLSAGAALDFQDAMGNTALFYATSNKNVLSFTNWIDQSQVCGSWPLLYHWT